MAPKIFHRVGLAACVLLVISCFMPWGYFADISQTFTGFYSYQNHYGKPGKFLTAIAVIVFVLMLLPKIWAKRTNLFVCALGVGYAIKNYLLFSTCYDAYCPQLKPGIYLMLTAIILMMLAAVFPDLKLNDKIAG